MFQRVHFFSIAIVAALSTLGIANADTTSRGNCIYNGICTFCAAS